MQFPTELRARDCRLIVQGIFRTTVLSTWGKTLAFCGLSFQLRCTLVCSLVFLRESLLRGRKGISQVPPSLTGTRYMITGLAQRCLVRLIAHLDPCRTQGLRGLVSDGTP